MSRKSNSSYIDGIYIGGKIGAYRNKFKQIGKNIFVIVRINKRMDLGELLNDPRELREVAKTKGLSTTLGEVMKEMLKAEYRKASPQEVAEYNKARTALMTYVQKEKAKRLARLQREVDASHIRLLKRLVKEGVLTSKGVVRVPIGCASDELRSMVAKFDSKRIELDVGDSDIKETPSRLAKKARSLHSIPHIGADNTLD
jgi:hypothetical protein